MQQIPNSIFREVLFLYQKKYGRMTIGAWLNLEMEQSNPLIMLLLGVGMVAGGILIRFFVGSPHLVILSLNIETMIPPVWLMTLLWTLSFLIVGCAAGFVLGYRARGCEVDKYKGGMLFVLLAVLELCWYPTFFGAGLLFLSVLESILILCLGIGTTLCFYRVSRFSGMLLLLHDLWLIYLLILNFAVFFRA
ncbi:MAG: tryptophan-rich sensory protein [Clostridia bacterium]|nr:tryptophan-rich sensory protein [Clostridia bacterium]